MPRLQTTFMVLLIASLGAIPALGQSGVIQAALPIHKAPSSRASE